MHVTYPAKELEYVKNFQNSTRKQTLIWKWAKCLNSYLSKYVDGKFIHESSSVIRDNAD